MIYERCYYKYGSKVLFVSEPICSNGMSVVFNCEHDDNDSEMDYRIVGEPIQIPRKELCEAKNLCERCFTCRYRVETKWLLRCTLHGKVATELYPCILPNCNFFAPLSSEPKPLASPPGIDFKKLFKDVKLKYKPTYLESLYYVMPPNVFGVLRTFLKEDDIIYFGTGASERLDKSDSFCCHERVNEYLDYAGRERSVLCYHACDVSEELYEKITTDLTDAELIYGLLCIPSIDFACFGDDYSVDYGCGNGYVIFANSEITEALKKENEKTDWMKYVYYLQKE